MNRVKKTVKDPIDIFGHLKLRVSETEQILTISPFQTHLAV